MPYDLIIIGAGPAGLFAAERISSKRPQTKVLVLDKGREITDRKCPARIKGQGCMQCKLCNISFGIGGAGGLSDGKLNLDCRIGMEIKELNINKKTADRAIKYIDDTFVKYGADGNLSIPNSKEANKWVKRAENYGALLLQINQRHMGSDKTPEIISKFKKDLMDRGVEFMIKTEVEKIESKDGFTVSTDKGAFNSKYLLVAPGRGGAYWFRNQAKQLGLEYRFGEIDVGLRVELDAEAYKPLTDIFYDPKFKIMSNSYNDPVRTFCTNPNGEVTSELIKDKEENIVLVNGHANKVQKTENTNFAILHTIRLTNPQEDTTLYGRGIAKFANLIGGGQPLVQRYSDLKHCRRSTQEKINNNPVQPTLKGCTPGDLAMAMPARTMDNLVDLLVRLEKIVPGVGSDSTLLYGPEIKFYDIKYETDNHLETTVKNLYVAGDGVGKSRGIVGAALGGLLVADGLLNKLR